MSLLDAEEFIEGEVDDVYNEFCQQTPKIYLRFYYSLLIIGFILLGVFVLIPFGALFVFPVRITYEKLKQLLFYIRTRNKEPEETITEVEIEDF